MATSLAGKRSHVPTTSVSRFLKQTSRLYPRARFLSSIMSSTPALPRNAGPARTSPASRTVLASFMALPTRSTNAVDYRSWPGGSTRRCCSGVRLCRPRQMTQPDTSGEDAVREAGSGSWCRDAMGFLGTGGSATGPVRIGGPAQPGRGPYIIRVLVTRIMGVALRTCPFKQPFRLDIAPVLLWASQLSWRAELCTRWSRVGR